MEKIALIHGGMALPWSTILLVLAGLGGVLLFLGLYLDTDGSLLTGLIAAGLSVALGLLFARWLHWYCYTETYESLHAAMTDFSTGGFGLTGVFAGCLAAACLTRLLRLHQELPHMLDCMSLAGLGAMAAGRLACLFNASNRGQLLQSIKSLPLAYPVTNVVSGATEYRLATFLLQAMVALVLLVALWLLFRHPATPPGDTTWVFLLLYGASQVVLDSTRYDSMFFRWNGFVSIVQVVGAIAMVTSMVIFARRLVQKKGFRRWHPAAWAAIVACLGVAGYMEYYVQRHGSQALLAYSVMSTFLVLGVTITLVLRHLSQSSHRSVET